MPLLFLELANTVILGWKFDILTLDQMIFNATGERLPKIVCWIVRYGLVIIMSLTVVVSAIAEFDNPLNLPGWALFFGWKLMLIPILLVFLGAFIPKSCLLCCLNKYSSKLVSTIEYSQEDDENAQKQDGGVIEGELELKENIASRGSSKQRAHIQRHSQSP